MSVDKMQFNYFHNRDLDEVTAFIVNYYPVDLRDMATWEDVFIRAKELSDVELLLLGLKP